MHFPACPAWLRLICLRWTNSAFEVSLLGLSGVLSGHALPTPLWWYIYLDMESHNSIIHIDVFLLFFVLICVLIVCVCECICTLQCFVFRQPCVFVCVCNVYFCICTLHCIVFGHPDLRQFPPILCHFLRSPRQRLACPYNPCGIAY